MTEESFYADVSNIPKNHEDETVNKILKEGSYLPMICIHESCWKQRFIITKIHWKTNN